MNPFKPSPVEWLTFILVSPFLVLVNHLLLFEARFHEAEIVKHSYLPILFVTLISWYLHIIVMHILRLKLPQFHQTKKRLLLLFVLHVGLTTGTFVSIFFTYDYFHFFGYVLDPAKVSWSIVIGILLTILASGTWEGIYIFQLWKQSARENELLQKMNLQNEFEALKNQLNPHFLFNSLNSLSSLIHENPDHAEKFLDEMSKVYRYILKNNQQELIDLNTELKFLQSYQHLLNTRYNQGFTLNINVCKNTHEYFLPPLTLQLLVENAVKHNIILASQPLIVDVFMNEQERIIVKNNLQKKSSKILSNKVGLSNIAMKYKLLNQPELTIHQTTEEFSVSVPLIK